MEGGALRRLQREAMTKSRTIAGARKTAKFPFLIHAHILRHNTGYRLANNGQDTRAIQRYLGHRSIVSTQRYTALARDWFKRFWKH
jgi:type 1 fimbriae regulatory protein FimB/type 1 fimbriae regulatory protein FimE